MLQLRNSKGWAANEIQVAVQLNAGALLPSSGNILKLFQERLNDWSGLSRRCGLFLIGYRSNIGRLLVFGCLHMVCFQIFMAALLRNMTSSSEV